jgi:predicted naringenin-chalcone synthase
MNRPCVITDFQALSPKHEILQDKGFEWLIEAHTKAETEQARLSDQERESFKEQITRKLHHVGCSSAFIHKRGHEIADFSHFDWDAMEIYRLNERPQGSGLKNRQKLHQKLVLNRFEEFFPPDAKAPSHLIHVTCTGYTSPSAAQILVANRKWHTTLTPCYHLGCYGSIPAIRLGKVLLQPHETLQIVHTELCTLHFNPLNHALDQLVGQSLFSDGWIKYSLSHEDEAKTSYLKILATHEKIIPNTASAMEWLLKDWGFHFKLSKEIPSLIAAHLKDFLAALCQKGGYCEKTLLPQALFAIHPGGPKIIDNIKRLLNLSEEQVAASKKILRIHGNMSSATLPHVWQDMCGDPKCRNHTPIISLAFGPGLTLAGALLSRVLLT